MSPDHASCTWLCVASLAGLLPQVSWPGLHPLHLSPCLLLWLGEGPQGRVDAGLNQRRTHLSISEPSIVKVCVHPLPAWVPELGTWGVVKPLSPL